MNANQTNPEPVKDDNQNPEPGAKMTRAEQIEYILSLFEKLGLIPPES